MEATRLVNRPELLRTLLNWRDTELIKVIQGVRRCGKSSLLDLLAQELTRTGVPASNIVSRHLGSWDAPLVQTAAELKEDLQGAFDLADPSQPVYVLLDEVQEVDGWERVVRALGTRPATDVYITGSNAYLLSGELSTLLAGRSVNIRCWPLSFKEYLVFCEANGLGGSRDELFAQFLRYGAMPGLFDVRNRSEQNLALELKSIYDAVVVKDVAQRSGVSDLTALERVVRYTFATSGNLFSGQRVANALVAAGLKISRQTVESYLGALENAYLLMACEQVGIGGKELLQPKRKLYPVDLGLRNLACGFDGRDRGFQLENVVYLELRRRGWEVAVGTMRNREIDFVARRYDERCYIQVTESLADEAVRKRELAPLLELDDAFPRLVLTLDPWFLGTTEKGIQVKRIPAWLLEGE